MRRRTAGLEIIDFHLNIEGLIGRNDIQVLGELEFGCWHLVLSNDGSL